MKRKLLLAVVSAVTLLSISNASFAQAPVITSNSGGATAAVNVTENTTAVTTVTATSSAGTITYSLSGGNDESLFSINSSTGELTFVSAPDFENPTDVGTNNVYVVKVRATDEDSQFDQQTVSVTVTDVSEIISSSISDLTPCPGTNFTVSAAIPGTFQNQTHQFTALLSDTTGSFTSPIVIGTLQTALDGNNNIIVIHASLPFSIARGMRYRVEVVSSTLTEYSSADNGQNIRILKARAGADRIISKCIGSSIDLTNIYQPNEDMTEWNTPNPQNVTEPGLYTLTVTSASGCTVSANVAIRDFAKPSLGNDTAVKTSAATYDLTTLYNTSGLSTRWNTTNPDAAPAGRYRLIVSNEGCKDTAVVKLSTNVSRSSRDAYQSAFAADDKLILNDGKLNAVMYPNPATVGSRLRVSGSTGSYTVTISDMSGKVLWRSKDAIASDVPLPIERLARGMYMIIVNSGSDIKTLKLIKE